MVRTRRRLPPYPRADLVGGGLDDELIPPANQRVLARGIEGAKLVLYPDAAHAFLAQDWRSFASHLTRFFRS
jgi:pimeloyl-ACP methyl ester carboxylesterase